MSTFLSQTENSRIKTRRRLLKINSAQVLASAGQHSAHCGTGGRGSSSPGATSTSANTSKTSTFHEQSYIDGVLFLVKNICSIKRGGSIIIYKSARGKREGNVFFIGLDWLPLKILPLQSKMLFACKSLFGNVKLNPLKYYFLQIIP